MRRTISALALRVTAAAFCVLLAACAGSNKYESLQVDGYSVQSLRKQDADELNQQLFAAAKVNVDPGDYLLGAGDLLEITVFGSDELNTKARISSRGFVTLPLLGQMEVKGLSAREAEIRIEQGYGERYLKDPSVSVFVKEHFSQRVTLMGEVKNPGTYDYLSKMRLLDVLALGGGLNEKAGRTAQIRRMGSAEEQPSTLLVDLDKMIREGRSEMNIEINGGDVIFIHEAGVFFVDGAVRRPGSYPLNRRTNLMEALSLAGGLKSYADTDKITLIRHVGQGERKVLELTMDDQEVQETPIDDRDVILVKSSSVGKFLSGFTMFLGVPGMAGAGYQPDHQ